MIPFFPPSFLARLVLRPGCLVLLFTVAAPAVGVGAPAAQPSARELIDSRRPLVIGHRGYSAFTPENSLAAFDRALAAGVDLVELDYHHAADGVPVVIHDGTLDRTTDAITRWGGRQLRVDSRSAADLATLSVGDWFKPPYPAERLPTLAQALDFIQPRGMTLIERKAGDAATLARLLRERGDLGKVVVQSFDWEFVREFHRLEPGQPCGALGPPASRDGRKLEDSEKVLDATWLDRVRATGAQVAVWNRQVNRRSIREAHRRGLRVWVYTINEPALAADLLALGVDGIITDNPAVIWREMALRQRRP